MEKTQNSKLYLLIAMGLLSAFGPFVTDFYLPALPIITKFFGTSKSMVQLSLTTGMLGLGVGQLLIGPLSDKFGRKPLILWSLVVFMVSTIACVFTKDIHIFIFFRLIQGFAGAGGVVISKSVAADLYKGKELISFFSLLMVVNGLGPIIAPVLGGFLINVTTWQGIFWGLLILGVLLFLLNLKLKESLSVEERISGNLWESFKTFVPILKNQKFMYYVLAQTFAMGFMFSYIASSPFLFQEHYHLSPIMFSICFAINAFGIMVGSWIVTFLSEKKALIIGGSSLLSLGILLSVILIFDRNIIIVESIFFFLMLSMGMILPTTSALGLNLIRENNGSASAILGFLPFLSGSIVSPLVGIGNIVYSTSICIIICCAVSLFFIFLAIKTELKEVRVNVKTRP